MGFQAIISVTPTLDSLQQRTQRIASGLFNSFLNGKMSELSHRALAIAQSLAPRQTGTFAAGLSIQQTGEFGFQIVTNEPELREMIKQGTGEYGPQHQAFTAISARAMVFQNPWPKGPSYGIFPNFARAGGLYALYAFVKIKGMQANNWEQVAFSQINMESAITLDAIKTNFVAMMVG